MPSPLESRIDDLYRLPPAEFTAARNALAKTLSGVEREKVRGLAKPSVVAWAVNQLYWQKRAVYDAVVRTGGALREAQVGALEGRATDVRAATDRHRAAVVAAVRDAQAIAAASRLNPPADAVGRTLEALALAASPPAPPGRLTEALAPSGFEALAGITPVERHAGVRKTATSAHHPPGRHAQAATPSAAERRAAERVARVRARARAEAERRLHDAEEALKRSEQSLAAAAAALADARAQVEHATRTRDAARQRVDEARRFLSHG